MNSNVVYARHTECRDCYKCIRLCPIKAIRVDNGHAKVEPEKCIRCGRCVTNCTVGAMHIRDDLAQVENLFQTKKEIIAALDPSFAAEFSECSLPQLIHALKMFGFTGVSETALGAEFISANIAKQIDQAVENPNNFQKLFLSSSCPSVVKYINQYKPEFSKYLIEMTPPILAHARFLRQEIGNDIGIVSIGPCIAEKLISDVNPEIDASIYFSDFKRWISARNIILEDLVPKNDDEFILKNSAKGSLYAVEGGMIGVVKKYTKSKDFNSMTISGIEEIDEALSGLNAETDLKTPLFMELHACHGGCINGPVSNHKISSAIKRVSILDYAKTRDEILEEKYIEECPSLKIEIPLKKENEKKYSEQEILTSLRSIGKVSVRDEINCASCGYDTCREFAKALLKNKAEKTMCVSYMRKLANKKANGLINAIPSGVIIADKNLNIVECNKNFANIIGGKAVELYKAKPGMEGVNLTEILTLPDYLKSIFSSEGPDVIEKDLQIENKIINATLFSIEENELAGAVIEDVTLPKVQKRRIVNQAKKVINKNLETVQKIAYLLGENAAESEAILNSIIDSYSDKENGSK